MNVLFVSQCSGNALTETRRILDQFGERCGDRVWQTPITEDGLAVVACLLRKTARKNTAVACHWIHGRNHSELLWIIGDRRRFNAVGAVPTNMTARAVLPDEDDDWRTGEGCRLLAALAALWHDVGKINKAFQKKLRGGGTTADAFRHEWLSLRLFQAFVGAEKDDRLWLERLAALGREEKGLSRLARDWLKALCRDADDGMAGSGGKSATPPCPPAFATLPPLARVIAWLVLGHHRLPVKQDGKAPTADNIIRQPLKSIVPGWGYVHAVEAKALKETWSIAEKDLPCFSRLWRERVARIARKLLDRPEMLETDWLDNTYALHVSRLGLMLADHIYSAHDAPERRLRGDAAHAPYANSDRQTHMPRQKLDEHLVGVERLSSLVLWRLGRLRETLPAVGPLSSRHFRKRSEDARFRWQDKASDLAASLAARSAEQGFFGLDLASTGCGKTLANGRICHALAGEGGLRFTVALGLRTLTLQTGDAYRVRLGLGRDELAVLAGDQAVRELHARAGDAEDGDMPDDGSESRAALFQADVLYEGLPDGPLARWLAATPGAAALVSAPVLACTIDHLIPATEGIRGGRQIAPMLRLMTSDLVLDEPDDFDVRDMYALSRLVFWAGMLGSRVILSSATITPSLAQGLFMAYREGREHFFRNRGSGRSRPVICAWFDEFGCQADEVDDGDSFAARHAAVVRARLRHLAQRPLRRSPVIGTLDDCPAEQDARLDFWAERIRSAVMEMHAAHHVTDAATGKRISFGLVRMANIDPLVRTVRGLLRDGPPAGTHWHVCCYHSRFPLLMRSALEGLLDRLLTRKLTDADFLAQPCARRLLARSPAEDHVVIVLATSVAEVGRDHDYDWAVVEPSSVRSLIQLAGRVRRHREGSPPAANICLLDKNLRALSPAVRSGEFVPAYQRPGFECQEFRLETHALTTLLTPEQLARLDAGARIAERETPAVRTDPERHCRMVGNLADLEHAVLREIMLGSDEKLLQDVALWRQGQATLTGEVQRKSRFRAQEPTETCLWLPDEAGEDCRLYRLERDGELTSQQKTCILEAIALPENISWLDDVDYLARLLRLAEERDISPQRCAQRFGRVELPLRRDGEKWRYHHRLGFFRQD